MQCHSMPSLPYFIMMAIIIIIIIKDISGAPFWMSSWCLQKTLRIKGVCVWVLIYYVKYVSSYTISLLIILYKLRSLFTRNLELFKIPFFKPGGGSKYNFTCPDFAFLVHSPSFFLILFTHQVMCVVNNVSVFLFLFCLFSFLFLMSCF